MHILSRRKLREFWERHPDSEQPLKAWYQEVKHADWSAPRQVTQRFPRASILGRDRVVFRIHGNAYRLVAKIFYPGRKLFIRFIGTHKEYDRINAEEV